MTFVFTLVSAAMLIFSLFMRVELIEINDKNVELSRELASPNEESGRLRIEYEFAQNLDVLERNARNRLWMQSSLQRREQAIDTEPEDKAVVIDNG